MKDFYQTKINDLLELTKIKKKDSKITSQFYLAFVDANVAY